jgi:hypothetical protein
MATPTSPLGALVGIGGDEFIQDTSTYVGPYSHIYITADAVINDIKINGTSVKSSRQYTGTIPQGYLICAGEYNEIDYIKLTSGSAEGLLFKA